MFRRTAAAAVALIIAASLGAGCGRRGAEPGGGSTAGPSPAGSLASTRPPTPMPTPVPTLTSAPGPTGLPSSLRGRDLERIATTQPVVALTFDAGANADGLAKILDTLAATGVRGTFFLTGAFADRYSDRVRAIVAAGHRIGNHSYDHPYLTGLPDSRIRDQVVRAEAAIRAVGADPRPLFRFPYGDRNDRTIAVVNGAGYACVRWTVDTLGWQGTGTGGTAQRVVDRVLGTARSGQIVLMHIGSHPTDRSTLDADALAAVIAGLRGRGYRFTTLDALLA